MVEHSPAPWSWGPDPWDGDHALLDRDGFNVLCADCVGADIVAKTDADAALIADAPALLEALQECEALLSNTRGPQCPRAEELLRKHGRIK